MGSEKKIAKGGRRIRFKKADYQKFARKMEQWSSTLSGPERALLKVVVERGSQGIKAAGGDAVHTTVGITAMEFDLGQFVVELLLAIQGISAEVDAEGDDAWVQEIDVGRT
jgi:hypothetical protein